jgi:hypothetical protein
MRHEVEHFRPGDALRHRIDRFAQPRGLKRHTALRVLLAAALERVERGEAISLPDPLNNRSESRPVT